MIKKSVKLYFLSKEYYKQMISKCDPLKDICAFRDRKEFPTNEKSIVNVS